MHEQRDNLIVRHYPEARFGGFTRVDGTVAFYTRVQALAHDARTILDVGCGPLDPAKVNDAACRKRWRTLRAPGRTVVGIDVNPDCADNPFIDEFRAIEPGKPWPIDDASVDCLVSDFVIEHLDEPEAFFDEVSRVLRPGGYACLRTPNRWHYVALAARVIPERLHARVVRRVQPSRFGQYPTRYRANSTRALRKFLRRVGLDGVVLAIETEPAYLQFSRLAFALGVIHQKLAPRWLRSTLLVFACKPSTSNT